MSWMTTDISNRSSSSSPEEALSRGRTMADIVDATLDKLPGLRQALPVLAQLAQGLRERGLVALNDRPLPSLAQIRAAVQALPLGGQGPLLEARLLMLSRLDRRRVRRQAQSPAVTADPGLETRDMDLSEFFEVSGMPIPDWLAEELAGGAVAVSSASQPADAAPPADPASTTGPVNPTRPAKAAAAAAGERRSRPRPSSGRAEAAQADVFVGEASMDDFMAALALQKRSG